MRYLFVFIFLFLSNCSGYTIASLSSNIATYSATGKTNSDHFASLVTGKDCKLTRILKEENYCEKKGLIINELDANGFDIVKSDSDLIFLNEDEKFIEDKNIQVAFSNNANQIFDKFYYGSLTWAKQHLKKGATISDNIGITKNLENKIEETFSFFN